jgi:hypothetical protein
MNRLVAGCVVLLAAAPALAGQDSITLPPPRSPHAWTRPVVHYGKWMTAATAVGFTLLAAHEHDRANQSWLSLLDLCRNDNASCQVRGDGRYVSYQAELLYQETLYYDRRARHRLLAGQGALLASAALFLLDLRHEGGAPPNIPFGGAQLSVMPAGDGARLEMRLPF